MTAPGGSAGKPRVILLETIKRVTQKGKGARRPDDLQCLVRKRKPVTFRFKDDGLIPNHPRWPLIIYRGAVEPSGLDPAAVFEQLFDSHGWRSHGATASMTMPTIIRASMKSLASRAAAPGCGLEELMAASSTSRRAMLLSFRRAPVIKA